MTTVSWLTLFRKIIAVYCEDNTKYILTFCGKNELVTAKVSGIYRKCHLS
jgi:hypothetical protein